MTNLESLLNDDRFTEESVEGQKEFVLRAVSKDLLTIAKKNGVRVFSNAEGSQIARLMLHKNVSQDLIDDINIKLLQLMSLMQDAPIDFMESDRNFIYYNSRNAVEMVESNRFVHPTYTTKTLIESLEGRFLRETNVRKLSM